MIQFRPLYFILFCAFCTYTPVVLSHTVTPQIKFQVTGTDYTLLAHINTRLNETKKQVPITSELQAQSWQLESENIIRDTLQAFGYFKAALKTDMQKKPYGYFITYRIDLGPLLPITRLNLRLEGSGQSNPTLQRIVKQLMLSQGQGMTTETYQKIKRTLYKTATAEGYLDAHWAVHTASVDLQQYTATIQLTLKTGPCYKIGSIQFSENPLSTSFLSRYIPFKEGDAYRLSDILNLQTTLKNTGYFQQAAVQTQNTQGSTTIPLLISLTPAAKYYYTAGGGFSSDAGFHFKTEGLIRHVTDTGHQIAGTVQLSQTQKSVLGLYTIPGQIPTLQQHHIQCEIASYYLNQVKTNTQILSILSTRQSPDYKLTYSLQWHREVFKKSEDDALNTVYLLMPGVAINQTHVNWSKNNYHYKVNWRVQTGIKPLLSNMHFLKAEHDGNYFGTYNPWSPTSYLVLRLRAGYILASDTNRIPPSLSFYAGGYRYPRGHEEYKMGPAILASSTEYRHHLFGLFYLTPFADMSYDAYSPNTLKASAGIGLNLWYPSIGHIEVSYAKTYDAMGTSHPWKWIGRISTDF